MNAILATWQWDTVWQNRDQFLEAARRTIWMAFVALLICLFTGLGMAVLRLSRFRLVRGFASLYVNFFRGAPIIVLGFWVYYGINQGTYNKTPFRAGIVALTLMHTAFLSEVFRSGILAVPKGQREAAMSLGMGRARTFATVVLPQAAKVALPGTGNDFIGMIKDTSVFYAIGYAEILATTKRLVSDTFIVFPNYTAALVIYVTIAFILDFAFRQVERRLSRGDARSAPSSRGPAARRRQKRLAALHDAVRAGSSSGTSGNNTAPLLGRGNQ